MSPPLRAPRAPGPPRPALRALPYSGPGAPAQCRVCEPVTWFPLQPSRRSHSRGGGGGQEQANPAPPGAQRGNGLPAARPAAATVRSRPAGTRRPPLCPGPAPRSVRPSALADPYPAAHVHAAPGRPPPHLPPQISSQ
ncbi:vegetative cell wall protein gp1-like isoform X2 [Mustela erminea]|uniref:vegetative cell wall protein gp1-like isoform X2 n=1 Tax=Mustela erminea TaxID=36723 RepID=UPI0013866CF2|nr:vegetative cell wall protein gp1-like isoform X2 [Mustela erminea]